MRRTSGPCVVVGVFVLRARAQQAVRELKQAGFANDQLGMIAQLVASGEAKYMADEGRIRGGRDGIDGNETGNANTLSTSTTTVGMLPGVGPVIAGGSLVSVLTRVAVDLAGSLIRQGVSENEASYYAEEFRAGNALVVVRGNGRGHDASAILRRLGAYDIVTAPPKPREVSFGPLRLRPAEEFSL